MSIQEGLTLILFLSLGAATSLSYEPPAKGSAADEKRGDNLPKPLQDEHGSEVRLLAYSPKLKQIASVPGIYNFRPGNLPALPVYVWDLPSGKLKHVLVGHGKGIKYVGFMPDGDKLLSGAADGMVLWDPLKGTKDREHFKVLSNSATLTPSGKELFNWDKQAKVVIWDAQSVKEKRILTTTDEVRKGIKWVNELSSVISADERFLALGAGLMNRKIIVWDYESGKITATLNHDTELNCLRFSKFSRYLFAGGNEVRKGNPGRGVLSIWDTDSWKLIREIEVDEYQIRPILYLPKEDLVLSVDLFRPPEVGYKTLFKTLINGYSIKTGERLVSYDTQLAQNGYCTAAIYLEDLNAICIGGADGKISFFSVAELLKQKKQP